MIICPKTNHKLSLNIQKTIDFLNIFWYNIFGKKRNLENHRKSSL